MKMSKRRVWAVVTGIVLVTGTSIAGFKQSESINVTLNSQSNYNYVEGSLGSGHYNGTSRYIGCQTVGEAGKSDTVTSCLGKDSGGESMTCTLLPKLEDQHRLAAGQSSIDATDFGRDGSCEYLNVTVASSSQPKSDDGNSVSTGVIINDDKTNAKGSLGTAHRTADSAQQIGCKIKATGGWYNGSAKSTTVSCSAYDNGNPQKGFECTGTSAALVKAAMAIKDDSYLDITRSSGNCTKLIVKQDSRYDSHQGARR